MHVQWSLQHEGGLPIDKYIIRWRRVDKGSVRPRAAHAGQLCARHGAGTIVRGADAPSAAAMEYVSSVGEGLCAGAVVDVRVGVQPPAVSGEEARAEDTVAMRCLRQWLEAREHMPALRGCCHGYDDRLVPRYGGAGALPQWQTGRDCCWEAAVPDDEEVEGEEDVDEDGRVVPKREQGRSKWIVSVAPISTLEAV